MPTKINWCDETINPIQDSRKGPSGRGYHCTKCSPGCDHCYAERINKIRGNGMPFDDAPAHFELVERELQKPYDWQKPRSVFVQSMGDLFHEAVPFLLRLQVWKMADECRKHTILTLTKRPQEMLKFYEFLYRIPVEKSGMSHPDNLWSGLTVCSQQEWDANGSIFMRVPGKKFLSIEPILGPVDLGISLYSFHIPNHVDRDLRKTPAHDSPGIDAVILGGETGPGARPMHPDWVRSVRDQCAAGVPFFFKQWGEWIPSHNFKGMQTTIKENSILPNRCAWMNMDGNVRKIGEGNKMVGDKLILRVGRKAAGRLLDGRTHDDLPWGVA